MNPVSPPKNFDGSGVPLDEYNEDGRELQDVLIHPERSMVEKEENDTAFVTPLIMDSVPYDVSVVPDCYAEFDGSRNQAFAFQEYKPNVTPLEAVETPDTESFHRTWSWTMFLFVTDGTNGNRSIQNPEEFENPETFLIDTDGAGNNHLEVNNYDRKPKPDYNDIGQSLKVADKEASKVGLELDYNRILEGAREIFEDIDFEKLSESYDQLSEHLPDESLGWDNRPKDERIDEYLGNVVYNGRLMKELDELDREYGSTEEVREAVVEHGIEERIEEQPFTESDLYQPSEWVS